MRYQGKISNWRDDQGYGFVVPNGGGEKAFVHIKSFKGRTGRPIDGDLITYEIAKDQKGRFNAVNIRFVNAVVINKQSTESKLLEITAILLLVLILVVSIILNKLKVNIAIWYLVISIITYVIYAKDKLAAKYDNWRTSENKLHFLSLIGGWPGAILAHKTLRHKSKKQEFRTVFWLTVLINFGLLIYFITDNNFDLLRMLSAINR